MQCLSAHDSVKVKHLVIGMGEAAGGCQVERLLWFWKDREGTCLLSRQRKPGPRNIQQEIHLWVPWAFVASTAGVSWAVELELMEGPQWEPPRSRQSLDSWPGFRGTPGELAREGGPVTREPGSHQCGKQTVRAASCAGASRLP